jgi:hypothetical protein
MLPRPPPPPNGTGYRRLLLVWIAVLGSVATFFLAAQIVPAPSQQPPLPSWVLTVAIMVVGTSVPVKNILLEHARKTANPIRVQSAQLIPMLMCQAVAVLGLAVRLTTGAPLYWLILAIATVGVLLHFPRRPA